MGSFFSILMTSIFITIITLIIGTILKSALIASIVCITLVLLASSVGANIPLLTKTCDYFFSRLKIYRKARKRKWYHVNTIVCGTFWTVVPPLNGLEKILEEEDWSK
jgi:hypothetical protein